MTKFLFNALILFLIGCTKIHEDDEGISDKDFVLQASKANTAAFDIGGLATTKAVDEGVKAFAQNVTAYHKSIQTQLKTLATTLNLAVADSLDMQHIVLKNQLSDLSGRAFDSLYVHTRVQDYRQATKLFFEEMISGRTSQLTAYSASVLPQLEAYLRQADSLEAKY